MDLPSNQALAINIAVTAASQRPPEADQRTVRTESQISAAAELICTVIRNCATASSLLSSLNRQLPLYKVRVLQRQAFWELYSDDDDLKKVFGVQRSTFAKLLRDLKPYLQPTRDSFFGRPEHPLELQVACSLYYLTKGTSYSTCIGVFGIGKSTAFKSYTCKNRRNLETTMMLNMTAQLTPLRKVDRLPFFSYCSSQFPL